MEHKVSCTKFGPNKWSSLFVHAMSGCHSISAPFGKKKSVD